MKRQTIFLLSLFVLLLVNAQDKWKEDVVLLENSLLDKEYLFQKITKKTFKNRIVQIKKSSTTKKQFFQKVTQLLQDFNTPNLEIRNNYKKFPFEIKQFNNKYYLTKTHPDYSDYLGYELLKTTKFTDTLHVHLLSKAKNKVTISLALPNLNFDNSVTINPKQTPFYLQKSNRWFWKYGINYGQQVYFKYNVGLSKEFLQKTMDSLQVSELTMAREYSLPLQTVYDAPTFTDFTEDLLQKFDNKRYKKLIIDVRNMTVGNTDAFLPFIKKISKLKRINKKRKLFVLIDKNVSPFAIALVLILKKELHITIIGERVVGIACNSNQIKKLELPNTLFTLYYPTKYFDKVVIEPDIIVSTSFLHYKNGVDPVLQKAMK